MSRQCKNELQLDIGGKNILIDLHRTRLAAEAGCEFHKQLFAWSLCSFTTMDDLKLPQQVCRLGKNYLFVERPSSEAKLVLAYHNSGALTAPRNQCIHLLAASLRFWHIPKRFVLNKPRQWTLDVLSMDSDFNSSPESAQNLLVQYNTSVRWSPALSYHTQTSYNNAVNENARTGMTTGVTAGTRAMSLWRFQLWLWVENREESTMARSFSITSMLFILISIGGLIISSVSTFQVNRPANGGMGEPIYELEIVEYICIAWFSLEFVLRLVAAPSLRQFVKVPLNLVDAITILPFYVQLLMPLVHKDADESIKNIAGLIFVLRLLRLLRVARLLKLVRYSRSLQTMGESFAASMQDLIMFCILLFTGVMFFATILYFVECDENPAMNSIPNTAWFCVITMTVVGYGDVVPITMLGQMIGSVANLCGMMVLAFPISIVVEKFSIAHKAPDNRAPTVEALIMPMPPTIHDDDS